MEFLCADTHLGAETEFAAVGEARGGVPVDRRGIDPPEESAAWASSAVTIESEWPVEYLLM